MELEKMREHTMQMHENNRNENPGYYRVSLDAVWDGGSVELEGTLRSLRVLRVKHSVEIETDEAPRFVVADPSLPLQEEIIADDGLVLIREERPPHLRQCVDIVVDRVAWNAQLAHSVEGEGVHRHCEI
jgi:hypothetical protein